jgi:hypothetical protein
MTWWELKRVALGVGAIAVLGLGIALAGSGLFGGWTRGAITLWLVLIALPMLLAAGGHAGTVPFGGNRTGHAWGEAMANDHLARRVAANTQEEVDRQLQMSWTTAIALAGVVLLVVAGLVTMV